MVHPFKKARWFVRNAQFGWGGAPGSVWWLYIQSFLSLSSLRPSSSAHFRSSSSRVVSSSKRYSAISSGPASFSAHFRSSSSKVVSSSKRYSAISSGPASFGISIGWFDDYEFIPAFQLPLACRLIADRYDFGAGQLREFDDAFVHFEGGASGTIGCYREIVPCGDPFSELSNCLGTASARRTSYCVLLELSDEGDAVIAVLAHAYEYGDLRFFNGFCIIIYEVEEAAVPEGEDASAPVGVFFEDVQSGGGELVQAAGALLEEVEKESKEFCKEFMHNPLHLGG